MDDFAIAGTSEDVEAIIQHLEASFNMKRMGDLDIFVGLEITRNRQERLISLGQQRYIAKLLSRFNITRHKHYDLPIPSKTKFNQTTDLDEAVDATLYLQHVGSVMFLMLGTRPDLAYACCALSRFNRAPNTDHLSAVKRVLGYIATASTFKLVLGGTTEYCGYVDAAWADDLDTGRSTCGYVFTLGNGAVSWSSQLQSLVTISTCEAEFIAATMGPSGSSNFFLSSTRLNFLL